MATHAHITAPQKAPRRRRTPAVVPDMPHLSEDELEFERQLQAQMRDLHGKLVKRNLEAAVLLAEQALQHGGELAEHFGELGRRFNHLLDKEPAPQSRLRVVKGGAV